MEIASCFDYRYILVLTSGGSLLFGDFAIFECLLNKGHFPGPADALAEQVT